MADIIKGSDLMLFVKKANGTITSLAFATNHTFNVTAETSDITTKDHGFWGGKEITRITWEITSDNLYSIGTFNELYNRFMTRQAVEVYFCLKTPSEREGNPATVNLPGDTYTTWSPTTVKTEAGYYGLAYITSLNVTAQAGDNATFSITLQGNGALAQGVYGNVEQAITGGTTLVVHNGVTYEQIPESDRTGAKYDSNEDYYIISNGEPVKVEITQADYTSDNKQVYYKVKEEEQS